MSSEARERSATKPAMAAGPLQTGSVQVMGPRLLSSQVFVLVHRLVQSLADAQELLSLLGLRSQHRLMEGE